MGGLAYSSSGPWGLLLPGSLLGWMTVHVSHSSSLQMQQPVFIASHLAKAKGTQPEVTHLGSQASLGNFRNSLPGAWALHLLAVAQVPLRAVMRGSKYC